MAKITTGGSFNVTEEEMRVAGLLSEGTSTRDIAIILYDCTDGQGGVDNSKVAKYVRKVRRIMENPKVWDAYRGLLREVVAPYLARAMNRIGQQVDEEKDKWLANKAANDVLTRFMPMVLGEDDKKVVIEFEGMPKLGTPDQE